MTQPTNPYESSVISTDDDRPPAQAEHRTQPFVDGNRLCVSGDTVFPPVCVRTAAPVDSSDMKPRTLYWPSPILFTAWVIIYIHLVDARRAPDDLGFAPIPMGMWILGFASLAAYMAYFKRCRVRYGLTPAERQRFRRRTQLKWGIVAGLLLSMFIIPPDAIDIVGLIFAVLLISCVLFAMRGSGLCDCAATRTGTTASRAAAPIFCNTSAISRRPSC